jgi:hypothetical protein
MITDVVQRWREHRASYRPKGETINTRDYEVAAIDDDRTAKSFIAAHHYEGTYPAARFRFGLYHRGGELRGVAVYSVPVRAAVLARFQGAPAVELGRFVLLDKVAGNGETRFISQAHRCLRRLGIAGVVSFSDPVPRDNLGGRVVFPGHIGGIYQAASAIYTGRSKAEWKRLLPDGRIIHNRALAKIRKREKGYQPIVARLVAFGAEPLDELEDASAWLLRELPKVTRRFKHGGNHRYIFPIDNALRRIIPAESYPKFTMRPAA